MNQRNRQTGFSAIELLVGVVVLGLLAAVAVPIYQDQVGAARRSDARAALTRVSQRLERCRTQFYAYNTDDCPVSFPVTSENGHYAVTVTRNATSFTLTATPQGKQADDACETLTLDNLGKRGATGAGVETC